MYNIRRSFDNFTPIDRNYYNYNNTTKYIIFSIYATPYPFMIDKFEYGDELPSFNEEYRYLDKLDIHPYNLDYKYKYFINPDASVKTTINKFIETMSLKKMFYKHYTILKNKEYYNLVLPDLMYKYMTTATTVNLVYNDTITDTFKDFNTVKELVNDIYNNKELIYNYLYKVNKSLHKQLKITDYVSGRRIVLFEDVHDNIYLDQLTELNLKNGDEFISLADNRSSIIFVENLKFMRLEELLYYGNNDSLNINNIYFKGNKLDRFKNDILQLHDNFGDKLVDVLTIPNIPYLNKHISELYDFKYKTDNVLGHPDTKLKVSELKALSYNVLRDFRYTLKKDKESIFKERYDVIDLDNDDDLYFYNENIKENDKNNPTFYIKKTINFHDSSITPIDKLNLRVKFNSNLSDKSIKHINKYTSQFHLHRNKIFNINLYNDFEPYNNNLSFQIFNIKNSFNIYSHSYNVKQYGFDLTPAQIGNYFYSVPTINTRISRAYMIHESVGFNLSNFLLYNTKNNPYNLNAYKNTTDINKYLLFSNSDVEYNFSKNGLIGFFEKFLYYRFNPTINGSNYYNETRYIIHIKDIDNFRFLHDVSYSKSDNFYKSFEKDEYGFFKIKKDSAFYNEIITSGNYVRSFVCTFILSGADILEIDGVQPVIRSLESTLKYIAKTHIWNTELDEMYDFDRLGFGSLFFMTMYLANYKESPKLAFYNDYTYYNKNKPFMNAIKNQDKVTEVYNSLSNQEMNFINPYNSIKIINISYNINDTDADNKPIIDINSFVGRMVDKRTWSEEGMSLKDKWNSQYLEGAMDFEPEKWALDYAKDNNIEDLSFMRPIIANRLYLVSKPVTRKYYDMELMKVSNNDYDEMLIEKYPWHTDLYNKDYPEHIYRELYINKYHRMKYHIMAPEYAFVQQELTIGIKIISEHMAVPTGDHLPRYITIENVPKGYKYYINNKLWEDYIDMIASGSIVEEINGTLKFTLSTDKLISKFNMVSGDVFYFRIDWSNLDKDPGDNNLIYNHNWTKPLKVSFTGSYFEDSSFFTRNKGKMNLVGVTSVTGTFPYGATYDCVANTFINFNELNRDRNVDDYEYYPLYVEKLGDRLLENIIPKYRAEDLNSMEDIKNVTPIITIRKDAYNYYNLINKTTHVDYILNKERLLNIIQGPNQTFTFPVSLLHSSRFSVFCVDVDLNIMPDYFFDCNDHPEIIFINKSYSNTYYWDTPNGNTKARVYYFLPTREYYDDNIRKTLKTHRAKYGTFRTDIFYKKGTKYYSVYPDYIDNNYFRHNSIVKDNIVKNYKEGVQDIKEIIIPMKERGKSDNDPDNTITYPGARVSSYKDLITNYFNVSNAVNEVDYTQYYLGNIAFNKHRSKSYRLGLTNKSIANKPYKFYFMTDSYNSDNKVYDHKINTSIKLHLLNNYEIVELDYIIGSHKPADSQTHDYILLYNEDSTYRYIKYPKTLFSDNQVLKNISKGITFNEYVGETIISNPLHTIHNHNSVISQYYLNDAINPDILYPAAKGDIIVKGKMVEYNGYKSYYDVEDVNHFLLSSGNVYKPNQDKMIKLANAIDNINSDSTEPNIYNFYTKPTQDNPRNATYIFKTAEEVKYHYLFDNPRYTRLLSSSFYNVLWINTGVNNLYNLGRSETIHYDTDNKEHLVPNAILNSGDTGINIYNYPAYRYLVYYLAGLIVNGHVNTESLNKNDLNNMFKNISLDFKTEFEAKKDITNLAMDVDYLFKYDKNGSEKMTINFVIYKILTSPMLQNRILSIIPEFIAKRGEQRLHDLTGFSNLLMIYDKTKLYRSGYFDKIDTKPAEPGEIKTPWHFSGRDFSGFVIGMLEPPVFLEKAPNNRIYETVLDKDHLLLQNADNAIDEVYNNHGTLSTVINNRLLSGELDLADNRKYQSVAYWVNLFKYYKFDKSDRYKLDHGVFKLVPGEKRFDLKIKVNDNWEDATVLQPDNDTDTAILETAYNDDASSFNSAVSVINLNAISIPIPYNTPETTITEFNYHTVNNIDAGILSFDTHVIKFPSKQIIKNADYHTELPEFYNHANEVKVFSILNIKNTADQNDEYLLYTLFGSNRYIKFYRDLGLSPIYKGGLRNYVDFVAYNDRIRKTPVKYTETPNLNSIEFHNNALLNTYKLTCNMVVPTIDILYDIHLHEVNFSHVCRTREVGNLNCKIGFKRTDYESIINMGSSNDTIVTLNTQVSGNRLYFPYKTYLEYKNYNDIPSHMRGANGTYRYNQQLNRDSISNNVNEMLKEPRTFITADGRDEAVDKDKAFNIYRDMSVYTVAGKIIKINNASYKGSNRFNDFDPLLDATPGMAMIKEERIHEGLFNSMPLFIRPMFSDIKDNSSNLMNLGTYIDSNPYYYNAIVTTTFGKFKDTNETVQVSKIFNKERDGFRTETPLSLNVNSNWDMIEIKNKPDDDILNGKMFLNKHFAHYTLELPLERFVDKFNTSLDKHKEVTKNYGLAYNKDRENSHLTLLGSSLVNGEYSKGETDVIAGHDGIAKFIDLYKLRKNTSNDYRTYASGARIANDYSDALYTFFKVYQKEPNSSTYTIQGTEFTRNKDFQPTYNYLSESRIYPYIINIGSLVRGLILYNKYENNLNLFNRRLTDHRDIDSNLVLDRYRDYNSVKDILPEINLEQLRINTLFIYPGLYRTGENEYTSSIVRSNNNPKRTRIFHPSAMFNIMDGEFRSLKDRILAPAVYRENTAGRTPNRTSIYTNDKIKPEFKIYDDINKEITRNPDNPDLFKRHIEDSGYRIEHGSGMFMEMERSLLDESINTLVLSKLDLTNTRNDNEAKRKLKENIFYRFVMLTDNNVKPSIFKYYIGNSVLLPNYKYSFIKSFDHHFNSFYTVAPEAFDIGIRHIGTFKGDMNYPTYYKDGENITNTNSYNDCNNEANFINTKFPVYEFFKTKYSFIENPKYVTIPEEPEYIATDRVYIQAESMYEGKKVPTLDIFNKNGLSLDPGKLFGFKRNYDITTNDSTVADNPDNYKEDPFALSGPYMVAHNVPKTLYANSSSIQGHPLAEEYISKNTFADLTNLYKDNYTKFNLANNHGYDPEFIHIDTNGYYMGNTRNPNYQVKYSKGIADLTLSGLTFLYPFEWNKLPDLYQVRFIGRIDKEDVTYEDFGFTFRPDDSFPLNIDNVRYSWRDPNVYMNLKDLHKMFRSMYLQEDYARTILWYEKTEAHAEIEHVGDDAIEGIGENDADGINDDGGGELILEQDL